jgi:tight adherence protein C
MREERFMRAERIGAMASQKLLVPTVLLIFPVVFMIIFGPLVLQFIF